MELEAVGAQFAEHYYKTFQTDRTALRELYGPQSMLSWEGKQYQGQDNIIAGLKELTFESVQHTIVRMDVQPSANEGIMIMITGDLSIDKNEPMKYAQSFNLIRTPAASYMILNDIFRLCIG